MVGSSEDEYAREIGPARGVGGNGAGIASNKNGQRDVRGDPPATPKTTGPWPLPAGPYVDDREESFGVDMGAEIISDSPIVDTPLLSPDRLPLSTKDTNPKDAVGTQKWRQYCTVPTTIIWELGVAMLEGARKYGRHNYRIAGVRASVYIDAAKGHIDQWWEGEDIDEESRLNHLVKAVASLVVLRDAMIQGKWVDDRPPKTDLVRLRADLQEAVDAIFERVPEAQDAYLEGDQYDED